jgi:predicted transcriptional regulator
MFDSGGRPMPKARSHHQPTQAELTILEVLWEAGPSTVRQVHDTLRRTRKSRTGYTTVLKLMQIMTHKGLVDRDESSRSHVYASTCSRDITRRGLVTELIEKAFSGSTSQLVLSALSTKRASDKELAAIREFLDQRTNREDKS